MLRSGARSSRRRTCSSRRSTAASRWRECAIATAKVAAGARFFFASLVLTTLITYAASYQR